MKPIKTTAASVWQGMSTHADIVKAFAGKTPGGAGLHSMTGFTVLSLKLAGSFARLYKEITGNNFNGWELDKLRENGRGDSADELARKFGVEGTETCDYVNDLITKTRNIKKENGRFAATMTEKGVLETKVRVLEAENKLLKDQATASQGLDARYQALQQRNRDIVSEMDNLKQPFIMAVKALDKASQAYVDKCDALGSSLSVEDKALLLEIKGLAEARHTAGGGGGSDGTQELRNQINELKAAQQDTENKIKNLLTNLKLTRACKYDQYDSRIKTFTSNLEADTAFLTFVPNLGDVKNNLIARTSDACMLNVLKSTGAVTVNGDEATFESAKIVVSTFFGVQVLKPAAGTVKLEENSSFIRAFYKKPHHKAFALVPGGAPILRAENKTDGAYTNSPAVFWRNSLVVLNAQLFALLEMQVFAFTDLSKICSSDGDPKAKLLSILGVLLPMSTNLLQEWREHFTTTHTRQAADNPDQSTTPYYPLTYVLAVADYLKPFQKLEPTHLDADFATAHQACLKGLAKLKTPSAASLTDAEKTTLRGIGADESLISAL